MREGEHEAKSVHGQAANVSQNMLNVCLQVWWILPISLSRLFLNPINIFYNIPFCASDQEAGGKSTSLLSIVLPVVIAFTVIIIAIGAIVIVLWKRRKQEERRSHSPDHIYDVPTISGSQHTLCTLQQSDTAMSINPTLHAEVYPHEMKLNIAYGIRSTEVNR